jgi:type VI secretion system secreted protein VgrG
LVNAGHAYFEWQELVITAQDELTLICGGGYIKIKGGNVEIGGPGKLLIKNTGIKKAGSGSMRGVMKSFEPEVLMRSLSFEIL